jgi:ribosomal protein L9
MNGQTEMLIGQISGRVIVRENFDEKGGFLNKQTFKAEETIKKNGYYEIEVVTELFDKDKKLTDKYTTTYRCKPDEASVMVMAFPFSNPKSKETEINTTSEKFKELYDLDNLQDIELEMTFDSGLLNFFGSKSIIKIYDRKLNENKNIITSKINIKAYAWGIRIKQLNYTVNEKLNAQGLLNFQKFTEEDNSYFTMTYR